ncbi:hypothetical protein C2G38_2050374 [Gigaspora rosea]|uniref:HAT C-terminal dimerisation domain-containing protein n=1 Tax=Gigaspora rosea TaxID=44941 RepID=A0A397TZV9_9GLOM|nr:hypothetical protein C2G38_2050374 [Gigaspora rosea]
MSSIFSKSISQNESNEDSQNPESRIDSSKYSTSDKSISEFDKKRKKAKVKKSVGRPEDPVNKEYIKLGVRDKHGHVAMKCKYCEEMIEDDLHALNKKLRSYITSHEFWANIECRYKVLEPAKIAVKTVEASNVKFANVFLILIKMANMIKAMPIADTTLERLEFRKKCVSFYNKRWAEFDTDFYLLAYFLHPKYHGKGLVSEAFQIIYQKALTIWKSLDGRDNRCERVFSVLNWFTQKRQNRLTIKKVSNMAKLHAYYVTNARHELNYVGQDLSQSAAMFEEDIQLYDSEDDFDTKLRK